MKIISCYVENFGCISGQKFDFEEGLTVFCHENGWGKTTLATFLKAMLYGLPAVRVRKEGFENERAYYRPWQGGRYGGSLTFSVGGKRYRAERTFAAKESADEFALFDDLTNLPSDDYTSALGEELFGVDADAFERSTYFSERSEYVKADYSDIQRRLVNVSDFERCDAALKALDERRKEYFKTGKRGLIGEAESRQYEAEEDLRKAKEAARRYAEGQRIEAELHEKQQALLRRQAELSEAIRNCTDEKLRRTHAEQANRLRTHIEETEAEYTALTKAPLPDAGALREAEERCLRLRKAEEEQANARTQAMVRREIADSENKRRLAECRTGQEAADRALGEATAQLSKRKVFPYFAGAAGVIAAGMAVTAALVSPAWPFLLLLCLAAVAGGILLWRYADAKRRVLTCKTAAETAAEQTRQCLAAIEASSADPAPEAGDAAVTDDRRALSDFLLRYAPDCETADLDRVLLSLSSLGTRLHNASVLSVKLRAAKEEYNAYLKEHPDLMREGTVTADEDTLQREAGECRTQLEKVMELDRENKQKYTPLFHPAEHVFLLEQEIADLKEKLPQYRHRLAVIQSAAKYLIKAKETLTAGYLDSVQQRFTAYVTAISSLDKDLESRTYRLTPEFNVTVEEGGATHAQISVSHGTRDLLALCLRLALRDAVFTAEVPPLLLDDPFTAYDDRRVKAAVALLRALSDEQQIIYFVCHTART